MGDCPSVKTWCRWSTQPFIAQVQINEQQHEAAKVNAVLEKAMTNYSTLMAKLRPCNWRSASVPMLGIKHGFTLSFMSPDEFQQHSCPKEFSYKSNLIEEKKSKWLPYLFSYFSSECYTSIQRCQGMNNFQLLESKASKTIYLKVLR